VFYDSYHKIARIQFSNTILWILKKLVTIAKDINQNCELSCCDKFANKN